MVSAGSILGVEIYDATGQDRMTLPERKVTVWVKGRSLPGSPLIRTAATNRNQLSRTQTRTG